MVETSMKIMHIPFCFYPDPVGGTEIYVETLSYELQKRGVDVVIAAPAQANATYKYNGLSVQRFAITPHVRNLSVIYGAGDEVAANNFISILEDEKPDLVHLHAFTSAVSNYIVKTVKDRHIPLILTYHTPTISCIRGTLLRWGNQLCDGHMNPHMCAPCKLHQMGLPKLVSYFVGNIPSRLGKIAGKTQFHGDLWTAVRMYTLIRSLHHATHNLFEYVDKIIVMAEWSRQVLIRNQVNEQKIQLIKHGIPDWEVTAKDNRISPDESRGLRLIYLGRIDRVKGLHILIEAVKKLSPLPISLDIYGVIQTGDNAYSHFIRQEIDKDSRISLKPSIPHKEILPLLREYHALVVPSQCLETGPLVVLEALATRTPIVGSNLGGIQELVEHEVNGLLVEPSSVAHWQETLIRLLKEPDLWGRLRDGIIPPRTVTNVADEMMNIYSKLVYKTDKLSG